MAWKILCTVALQHNFFPTTNSGPELDFVPSMETQTVMQSVGMLSRVDKNRILLSYDDEKEEILLSCIPMDTQQLEFIFQVYAQDLYFGLYSESSSAEEAPCYSNIKKNRKKNTAEEDGIFLTRCAGDQALAIRERAGNHARYPAQPAVLNFVISITKETYKEPKEYLIHCASRKTYWKYYLLGELADHEAEIIDLKGEINFQNAGHQFPFPGRTAMVFYSTEPIPLEERPNRQFQLRQSGNNGNKVLIKRLPNASIENLARDTLKGEQVNVSEIYINY
ncbi:MAG: hypothetical protein Q3M24_23045 [Candidatus Electrothrix aestuarii]|uniref:Uncharacterized protein n=1 Tax=Candidatus Electrothrix aestuarii TaxID=3062594 RepID=A0AAU8LWA5_9BACT|nr:hypothetical protein [Candidatus Electrothrix aestuarii]